MSNIIKELRKKAGLTQSQLARKCNLDQSDISLLENDKIAPSSESSAKLAKALGICPAQITIYYTCLRCSLRDSCNKDCFKPPTFK